MSLVAILLTLLYAVLFIYTFNEVLNGRIKAVLFYAVIFFPVYPIFLSINYDFFESASLSRVIQYSKELIIFTSFGLLLFGGKRIIKDNWHITFLDTLILIFIALTFVFFFLGIGDATFVNRALYVKNILVMAIFYFFGRNVEMSIKDWNSVFRVVFTLAIIATCLAIVEKLLNTHFHQYAGFAKYNLAIRDQEPTGVFGLTYTFEAEGGRPRFASFFAHPLELASAMLVVGAACLYYLIYSRDRESKKTHIFILVCSLLCLIFAYSRASFASYVAMFVFMAMMLKYYKIIFTTFLGFIFILAYIFFGAPDEVRYFVIDTVTFTNSSSLTHVADWLTAIESIITDPFGIGLAMSGNASGVEQELMVGGENQFLVFGVQLGVLGMVNYIAILVFGIRHSWLAFRRAESRDEGLVPFVAAATKFGLILPLLTANAEVYLYISLFSWWMIGQGETTFQRSRQVKMTDPRLA